MKEMILISRHNIDMTHILGRYTEPYRITPLFFTETMLVSNNVTVFVTIPKNIKNRL